jgi:predicted exporter
LRSSARWAVGVWLIGVLVCVILISRAEFSADLSAFLPRSPSPTQQILVEQLRDGVVSRLILLAVDGAPPETLAKLSKDLANRLRPEPGFASVNNGEDVGLEKDRDFLWRNRYLLSPAVSPERFSAAGLRQALENDLQLLGSPAGMLVKRVLPGDPTGELLHLLEQLESTAHPATRDGVWFSQDGKRALLLLQTQAPGFDIDAQQRALAIIHRAFEQGREVSGAHSARLLESGPGVFSVSMREKIKGDALRFSLLATFFVASLLLLVYRSVRVLLLASLPVASGALAGVAAVSLGFGSVHGITLGFGATLIGEAVDYAIYLFTQTEPGSPPEKTLPRIWPTLRLGVLTSLCGFSAMLFSGFTGLAQLGLFSIAGLVVAVNVTRWVLPALMPKNFSAAASTAFAPAALSLMRRSARLRLPLLLAVILAALFLSLPRGGLWDDELSSLSPLSQEDQRLDELLRGDIGAPDARYLLLVNAPGEDQALAASEALAGQLQALVGQGALTGFDSPALALPSQTAQRARQKALPVPDALRANLEQALVGLPFRADLFEPFLQDVAAAKTQPLLDRSSLRGSSLSLKLDSLLVKRPASWVAMLPLRGVSDPQRLREQLGKVGGASLMLLDLKGESDQLYRTYRHEALVQSLLGSLVIVVLLGASLRSPRRVYDVLAPLIAAVIITTAVLIGSGQKLSIFHLVGLSLVVAIGSNYSLFFERQNFLSQDRERTVASLLLANISTVIGFGMLSFSHIPVLHGIGMTVAIGAMLSLIFSAILTAHGQAGKQ